MCAAAAYDLAWELFLHGDQLTYQQFVAVAGRSGELNQVDRLLDQGRKFGDMIADNVSGAFSLMQQPISDRGGRHGKPFGPWA